MAIKFYDLCGAETDRNFSPNCWRTRLALAHKELAVEPVPTRFTDKDKIAFSGQKLVPIIVDSGRVVPDSWAIATYLEDAYPKGKALFPGGGRQLTRFVNEWTNRALYPVVRRIVIVDIHAHLGPEDQAYFRASREHSLGMTLEAFATPEQSIPAFRQALEPLRAIVATQPFLAGEGPAYADYTVFSAFQWARCISAKRLLAEDDPVYAWRERVLSLFGGLAAKAKGYPV